MSRIGLDRLHQPQLPVVLLDHIEPMDMSLTRIVPCTHLLSDPPASRYIPECPVNPGVQRAVHDWLMKTQHSLKVVIQLFYSLYIIQLIAPYASRST
jgi:hypothetical protein